LPQREITSSEPVPRVASETSCGKAAQRPLFSDRAPSQPKLTFAWSGGVPGRRRALVQETGNAVEFSFASSGPPALL